MKHCGSEERPSPQERSTASIMTGDIMRNKKILIALILGASATSAVADTACNLQTTRGSWVYTCEGTLPVPSPTNTRMLGTCLASRTGYWSCNGNVNLGGQIIPQKLDGQASIKADCTGFISYSQTLGGSPGPTLEIDYVVSEGGNSINGLPVSSGGVVSCSLKRISGLSD
jgi:hypothetical protein